jgi:putative oxidoreductase
MNHLPNVLQDAVLLIARIAIGAVFIAHGWQKLSTNGIDSTSATFRQADVPLATASAWVASLIEIAGGIALIAGVLVPVFATLLALDMLGAYLFVHMGEGMFVNEGGFELVLALGVASLLFMAFGAGRYSVDRAIATARTDDVLSDSRPRHRPILGH